MRLATRRLKAVAAAAGAALAVGVTAAYGGLGGADTQYGTLALAAENGGNFNSAFGYSALFLNTTGTSNSAIGVDALALNTTGSQNTALGENALEANVSGTGGTAVGFQALFHSTGDHNTAVGHMSMDQTTTGHDNAALGQNSLFYNSTGSENAADGVNALYNNTTGSYNTASGHGALFSNSTGGDNTALGWDAGWWGGHPNTTGSSNTFLGARTGPATDSQLTDATAIGADAQVGQDNSIVLGAAGVNVGVATTTPQSRIQIGTGASSTWGDYLQIPVVTATDKTTPASDCNTTTLVGRIVLQRAKKKVILWACPPTGVWTKV